MGMQYPELPVSPNQQTANIGIYLHLPLQQILYNSSFRFPAEFDGRAGNAAPSAFRRFSPCPPGAALSQPDRISVFIPLTPSSRFYAGYGGDGSFFFSAIGTAGYDFSFHRLSPIRPWFSIPAGSGLLTPIVGKRLSMQQRCFSALFV